MAERLPVGAARSIKSPTFTSPGCNPAPCDIITNTTIDKLNVQPSGQELESNELSTQLLPNGSNVGTNRSSGHNRPHQEATARNGGRTKEVDSRNENEWVEQDEPGVYITLTSLPGGAKDLKRVRFRYIIFSLCLFLMSYLVSFLCDSFIYIVKCTNNDHFFLPNGGPSVYI